MKVIRVSYRVRPDYASTNKANIEAVMEEIRSLNNPNLKYASFVEEDGVTFMHFAMYPDEESASIISSLESFQHFRSELKSGVEVPPKADNLNLVASGYELFA